MTHRHLWLGTAFVGLLIGFSAPAGAQQYYFPYKQNDKPAVEVDLSALDAPPASASGQRVQLADYIYKRSPAIENTPPDATVPDNVVISSDTAPQPVAPAPEKKAEPKKAAKTKKKPPATRSKPSLVVTDEPAPEDAVKHPKPSNAPIISLPPAPEAAQAAPVHHDMTAMPPIISNPPDSGTPPVVQRAVQPTPAPVVAAPIAAPAPASEPAIATTPPAEAPAPVEAAPHPRQETTYERAFEPAHESPAPALPEVVAAPATAAPAIAAPSTEPAPVPAPVDMPEPAPAPQAPHPEAEGGSGPLPDITVIHPSDYPEDTETAQPDIPKAPRAEPLPLPKNHKPGHTTAPMLMPVPAKDMAPAPLPEPTAPEAAVAMPTAPAAAPATTEAQPVAAAPAETMPIVPSVADLTLNFHGNSSDLTTESQKKLDIVIRQMKDTVDGRLQVRGFATGEDGSKSSARRIALSRALMVRSYLMDKGVKPTRVDVRALGTETDRSPLDRVDLVFVR